MFILRVRSDNRVLEAGRRCWFEKATSIAVIGRQEIHVTRGDVIGPEVNDPSLLDIPLESLDVVITNRAVEGRSLAELSGLQLPEQFVPKFTRSGIEMPISAGKPRRPG